MEFVIVFGFICLVALFYSLVTSNQSRTVVNTPKKYQSVSTNSEFGFLAENHKYAIAMIYQLMFTADMSKTNKDFQKKVFHKHLSQLNVDMDSTVRYLNNVGVENGMLLLKTLSQSQKRELITATDNIMTSNGAGTPSELNVISSLIIELSDDKINPLNSQNHLRDSKLMLQNHLDEYLISTRHLIFLNTREKVTEWRDIVLLDLKLPSHTKITSEVTLSQLINIVRDEYLKKNNL